MKIKEEMKDVVCITNRTLCSCDFYEQIAKVCALHPQMMVLREKDLPENKYAKVLGKVKVICEKQDVQCVAHFFVDAAIKENCKRIQLPLWKMQELPEEKKCYFSEIGVSVHSAEEALEAEKCGATYLVAGHVFTTACKPGLEPRGLSFLYEVCQNVTIPVYGIGGIHFGTGQIQMIKEQGAKGACMMSELMQI